MGGGSVTCCLHRLGTSDTWPRSLLPAEGESSVTLSFLRLLSVPGEWRLLSSGGRRWRQARSCRGSTATPRGALPGCWSEGCSAGSSLTSLGWVLGSTAGTASGGFSFLLQGGGVG